MDIAGLRHIFASRIRKLREGSLNQGEFADSVGISRGAMSYYEQELRTPDIGVLRAICEKYSISADYLLGIIPDPNHSVSDICRETGLSPKAARTLNLITKLISTDFRSPEHLLDIFGEDTAEAMSLTPATSVPELLSVLLENEEGLSLLTLLGAIILGAEVGNVENGLPVIKIKSATKNFEIMLPIENLSAALWVNIQSDADRLKEKLKEKSSQPE